ncbi:MAG: hypothetical protein WCW26_04425 [Candidatus Buchananbacteria bacterium]
MKYLCLAILIVTVSTQANGLVPNACVTIYDATPPVLTVCGPNPLHVTAGSTWQLPEYSCADHMGEFAGDPNPTVQITEEPTANPAVVNYRYQARDWAGNVSTVVLTVIFDPVGEGEGEGEEEDTAPPVINVRL